MVVYGLFNRGNNDLMLQRLDAGKDAWTAPVLITSGDFGYLPAVTVAGDGTIYAVFNNGRNRDVDIGGLIADASGKSRGRDADAGGRWHHRAGLDRTGPQRNTVGGLYASAGGVDERDRDSVCSRGDIHATCSLLRADQVRARAARAAASMVSTGAGEPVHNSNARAPGKRASGVRPPSSARAPAPPGADQCPGRSGRQRRHRLATDRGGAGIGVSPGCHPSEVALTSNPARGSSCVRKSSSSRNGRTGAGWRSWASRAARPPSRLATTISPTPAASRARTTARAAPPRPARPQSEACARQEPRTRLDRNRRCRCCHRTERHRD